MQDLGNIHRFKSTILSGLLCLAAQFSALGTASAQTDTNAAPAAPAPAATNSAPVAAAPAPTKTAPVAPAPPPSPWSSVASADLTLTRGNSQNFLAAASINTSRKWTLDELLMGAGAGYGETTQNVAGQGSVKSKTQDFLKGFAQEDHKFVDGLYGGLRVEGLNDEISDIQYRLTVSPLLGYFFFKNTNTFLCAEVGPTYINERLSDHTTSYLAERAAERFEYKFLDGAKVWEHVEWIPQADKFKNWILNAEVGVSAPISKSLSVRLVADDTYNNQPANGFLKNDLKLMAGLGYRF